MKLIVMHGKSGSGKTSYAASLGGVRCSSDDYFYGEAHGRCTAKCEAAMKEAVPLIVVDDSNISGIRCQEYAKLAEKYGYEIEHKTLNAGVPS